MVAGNHDAPKTSETGCILRLFLELGIHVVDSEPQRLAFPDRDLSILAVPDVPGMARVALTPDPAARHNVLLLHGEVEGMLPKHAAPIDRAPMEISKEELGAAQWSYVALGHYHVYREIAPNAYYSGSVDYTSANAWGELVEERAAGIAGKGIIEHDLATGAHAFHPLPPARPLVDLPPLVAKGMTAAELDTAIRDSVQRVDGGIDERIVRLVVRDVPRHVARELDHKALREYKRRALHFHLDTRRPEILRTSMSGAPGRRPSLAETVREKLSTRLLSSDIDREALVALGLRYLEEADAVSVTTSATSADGAE
jgi:DNA repair exonuclease SbcCD nuclease subunit